MVKQVKRFKTVVCIIISLSVSLFQSCEQGLDDVVGFRGTVTIPLDSSSMEIHWPDSLKGAVIVVAEYHAYESLEQFFQNVITFSDPLDTTRTNQEYFVQTLSGYYLAGVVGITVQLSELFFLDRDSIASHPEYYVPIGIYKKGNLPYSIVRVENGEVTPDIDIAVDFNLVLPFK